MTARIHPYRECACERCGKVYVVRSGDRGRFCSNACRRNQVEKVCVHCHKTFSIKASHSHQHFCSPQCWKDAGCPFLNPRKPSTSPPRRSTKPSTRVAIKCAHCDTEFMVNLSKAETAKYCSRKCASDHRHVTFACARCGKLRTVEKYRVEGQGLHHCCNRCATLDRADAGWMPDVIGKKRRSGYRTDIERLTEAVLIEMGLPYDFERKVGRYSVDFCLPTLGIALECDGWQHKVAKNRDRDIIRDANILEKGWRVVRVDGDAIRLSPTDSIRNALAPYMPL